MTDIVERLRERHWRSAAESNDEAKERRQRERNEAADEIERLREWNREIALNAREFVAENEKLRAALRDAAEQMEWLAKKDPHCMGWVGPPWPSTTPAIKVAAEKARAALE